MQATPNATGSLPRTWRSRVIIGAVIGLLGWLFFAGLVLIIALIGWAVVGWPWFLAGLRLIAVLLLVCLAWGILHGFRRSRDGN